MRHLQKLLLLFFLVGQLHAQSYHFEQLSVGDGLPQSQVYALLTDSRGYLWLGTQGGGLARFDGEDFKNFSVRDGLAGNYVQAIEEDARGDIWIGTNNGVSRFYGRGFENFRLENAGGFSIQSLAMGENDTLWIAAQQGVFGLADGQFFSQKNKNGNSHGRMWSAFTDSRGTVWMGGGDGVFRKRKNSGEWRHVWKQNREILAFGEALDGRILASVFELGLLIWDGTKWERLTKEDGLPSNRIQGIWTAPDGRVWLGTQDAGLVILTLPDTIGEGELKITQLAENQGLCNKNIRSITGDRWGNVWLGTSGSGVCKYGGQEFEHLTTEDGLRSNFVYSLATDTSGGLWLSAGDRGISFRSGDSLANFGADHGFLNLKCRAMHRDSKGRIWVGTEGEGIATMLEPDTNGVPQFRFINRKNGLAGNWIRDIAEDAAGNLWVATTDGGLGRMTIVDSAFTSLLFKKYGAKAGLPVRTVHQLHFDKTGRLWMAAQRQGLFFKSAEIEKIERFEMPAFTVRSMAEDTLGQLWFGTAGRGIGRIDIYGEEFSVPQMFGVEDGLASANIYLLQFDPQGQLWVGTERGVDRLRLDASGNPVEVRHYGLAEGFRGVEVCQNASLLDGQGNLWFGTVNGLTKYRTSQTDTAKSIPPKVHFTEVKLFYEPLENSEFGQYATDWGGLSEGAIFPHDKNHLGFEFFAPNFPNPERLFYSWKLMGQEEEWSPFSKRDEVSYANLPPGEYSFSVRAMNEDGLVGPAISTAFQIETPYWKTSWFRISMVVFLALMVGLVFWSRLRRLRKKSEAEKQRLEMKNHLLQLEQKARQLQMNPHFIFNALNSIQSLVTRGDSDGARQYILKFGRLMRAVLDNSRQAFIPLEKEVDTLRKYLEMEQFCRDGNFDFNINMDGVESDDLNIPPMLLQPFLENAILHGVAPLKERKGEINLEFIEKENLVQIEVSDNGVGFDSALNISGKEKNGRKSAGVSVTKERIKLLGGEMKMNSEINVGTTVFLQIPIGEGFK